MYKLAYIYIMVALVCALNALRLMFSTDPDHRSESRSVDIWVAFSLIWVGLGIYVIIMDSCGG